MKTSPAALFPRRHACRAMSDEQAKAQAAANDDGEPTIFDKIIAKEIPAEVIYEVRARARQAGGGGLAGRRRRGGAAARSGRSGWAPWRMGDAHPSENEAPKRAPCRRKEGVETCLLWWPVWSLRLGSETCLYSGASPCLARCSCHSGSIGDDIGQSRGPWDGETGSAKSRVDEVVLVCPCLPHISRRALEWPMLTFKVLRTTQVIFSQLDH